MTGLTREQKELLFDYCMGLTSEERSGQAEGLISSNREAAEICSRVKATLSPLDTVEPEPCPDDLVESTLSRLIDLANSSRGSLHDVPAGEQRPKMTFKPVQVATFAGRFATAAIFLIAATIFLPALGYLRHHSRLQRCQMQQSGFFKGLGSYIADHDGRGPAIAAAPGAPWWKVGYQGAENHSNTRKIYLLVQGGYVDLSTFVCPGSRQGRIVDANASQIQAYRDFPDRRCVTYSFQINCRRMGGQLICQKVVMADCNPLFEEVAADFSKPFELRIDKESLKLNSRNHSFLRCRRGQNILFDDGHAKFFRTRHVDLSGDDIFTLQNIVSYRGFEVPSDDKDLFLAP